MFNFVSVGFIFIRMLLFLLVKKVCKIINLSLNFLNLAQTCFYFFLFKLKIVRKIFIIYSFNQNYYYFLIVVILLLLNYYPKINYSLKTSYLLSLITLDLILNFLIFILKKKTKILPKH